MQRRSNANQAKTQTIDHDRRNVLRALGVAATVCPFSGPAFADASENRSRLPRVADVAVAAAQSAEECVPFYGPHQAGVTTPRPANGMIASFDVVADTVSELESLFRRLTERIAFLTAGGKIPADDPRLPPRDSGILGPIIRPDALTVTVSVGASLFDDRPLLRALKPRRLARMAHFPNDALDKRMCHGDLSLQICAHTQDTTIHALRDIIKNCSSHLLLKWKQEGSVPAAAPRPDGVTESARNFLGFRDGSANPDPRDAALMDRLVWVDAARDEPAWAVGGSYQVVRIIRNFVERWDRTPLQEQERIIGRFKMSGAPLDKPDGDEFAVPDYEADPSGRLTPLDAHIRRANPRTPQRHNNRILRRPFNYSNGVTKSGQLDQGLLFICYQADLEEGFIAIQQRLNGEPLEEYIKPVGGGYFFTLPGARDASDYLGRSLIAAARDASESKS